MKKIIICLFVAFSLLSAPVAHAIGLDCGDSSCKKTESVKEQSQTKKTQDNDKLVKAEKHCCCAHTSSMNDGSTASNAVITIDAAVILHDDAHSSIVSGPPLEPPSHV